MTTVLVIEDDSDHQYLILRALNRAGIGDVKIVTSLDAGIAACHERPRDVLIVDSGAVGEKREGAINRLRADCPVARIIGYSAGVQKVAWADAHFTKGEPIHELIDEVRGRPLIDE